ncbi:hypothetical protein HMPREF1147_0292 [Selenomonas sp. FOBRC9]|nr:hypothetical protein HMPREF1147_0292 [Selenomonas sp. FOBRC9]
MLTESIKNIQRKKQKVKRKTTKSQIFFSGFIRRTKKELPHDVSMQQL